MVFLMNMERRLLWTQTSELMLHPKLGVAMPYINRKLNICRRTLMQEAFEEQRRLDELAERARLLYVAMTRAKLHLELVATVTDLEHTKWDLDLPPSDSRVREAGSMITWVMQAISTDAHTKSTNYPQASTPWDCRDWDELPQKTVDKVGETEADASKVLSLLQTAPPEGVFPEKTVQTDILPLKTSVSALVKKQADALPLSDVEEDAETKHAVDENGTPLLLSELPRRPAFMEEKRMTAAERGTLTHRALSLMPLDALRVADDIPTVIREALEAMQKRGLFTEEELHIISVGAISGYFTSEIGRRMLQSGNVRREWAFNLRLTGQQALLLQGVIDCAFEENGAWVLVDYKTDADAAGAIERGRRADAGEPVRGADGMVCAGTDRNHGEAGQGAIPVCAARGEGDCRAGDRREIRRERNVSRGTSSNGLPFAHESLDGRAADNA